MNPVVSLFNARLLGHIRVVFGTLPSSADHEQVYPSGIHTYVRTYTREFCTYQCPVTVRNICSPHLRMWTRMSRGFELPHLLDWTLRLQLFSMQYTNTLISTHSVNVVFTKLRILNYNLNAIPVICVLINFELC